MIAMKRYLIIAFSLMMFVCFCGAQKHLESNCWNLTKGSSVSKDMLVLEKSKALLKMGNYRNFVLTMEVKTSPGAKGCLWFHTDKNLSKGYKIAINNDQTDNVWWRMTGSLVSVRNLAKSFIKENDWFKMRIAVEGKRIQVSVNNILVVDYIEPVQPYRVGKNIKALLSSGIFAIESDTQQKIFCRNIRVSVPKVKFDLVAQQSKAIDETTDDIIRLHQEDFPVLDYHVHLKGGLTFDGAMAQSRLYGINYAIAPNCGIGFPISTEQQVRDYLDSMRVQPCILAMQGEGREWKTTFSAEVRNTFDYVFTDAMTFTDNQGRRTRLWIPEETWIDPDTSKYMDMIVDRICQVLQEPMDVYVNPCFVPSPMWPKYDSYWTEARQQKFIKALVASGKVLEINSRYKIPNKAIILKAKAAGVKFTFGTNNKEAQFGKLEYCIQMKKECGLTASDMYKPHIKL